MPQPPPEPLYVLRGHRAAVQSVAFLPNSQALAAGDAEGELKLWDLDSQRPAASIRAHDSTSGILQVACPANHPWVISQGRDGVVKCWELHSGSSLGSQPVQQLASGCYNFCRFALLGPGQTSSSCSTRPPSTAADDQPAAATAAAPAVTVDGFAAPAAAAAEGSRQEASSSESGPGSRPDSTQQQVSSVEGLLRRQLQQQLSVQEGVQQQLPQQQGAQDAAQDEDAGGGGPAAQQQQQQQQQDDLTEAAEELLMHGQTATTGSTGSGAEGSAGPSFLALPCEDPAQLGVWQLGSAGAGGSSQRPQLRLSQSSRGQIMAVVLLQPQGLPLHVLTGHEDGSVALWDSRSSSTCLAAQKLHSEPVMCVATAADASSGFSGSADDKLATFDLDIPTGRLRVGPQLPLPQQGLADVAVRPDGRIAASAGWDAKVRVWHCRKRQPLAILRWHSQQVACVGFSPDCTLLAAGGRDNFISMWSLYPP